MKLRIEPSPPLAMFQEDLELVIRIAPDQIPEMHLEDGLPKPDRHFLLGIMQSVAMAVTERDPELVAFMDTTSIVLERRRGAKELSPGLIVVRTQDGKLAVLATADVPRCRVLAREGLRWFTGTIRLDIP